MSQRYEITPGPGLVARHGDSVLWVGADLAPEAWDALGAVLDVIPGTDPAGAETAASLENLTEVLRAHPATTFAALIISDGHAQGILRGPVTVCNTTAVAPATGYEQFGITVPFEMSEAVYVGNVEASGNHPSIAQLFDLDAGVVPGGGAWVHPITSGHRYASGASGTQASIDTGTHQSSAGTPAADAEDSSPAEARPAEAGLAVGAVVAGLGAAAATDASDEHESGESAAQSQSEPRGEGAPDALPPAQSDPDATQMYTADDHQDAGDGTWRPTSKAVAQDDAAQANFSPDDAAQANFSPDDDAQVDESHDSAAQDNVPGAPVEEAPDEPASFRVGAPVGPAASAQPQAAAPEASPVDQSAESGAAPASTAQPGQPSAGNHELSGASSNVLPSLSAPPSPWAMPDVAAGSETTAGAFTLSEDHLQIDLRAVTPSPAARPLPLIPTSPAGAQSAAQRSSVLVFDDGSTFALDNDYVIGRRPERHELVRSGQARPLTVVDPDTVLSGAHAALRLHGADVYLEDLGSLNGSHIARPGATGWTRLEPYTPERLEPGTRLLFGWTVATYSGGRNQA